MTSNDSKKCHAGPGGGCLRTTLSSTLTLTHSLTNSLTHSLTLTHSHTHNHSHTLTHSHTHTHSLTLTHSLTNSLTHSLTLTHSHTHTHSHSLTHTHTLTHTHSLTHSIYQFSPMDLWNFLPQQFCIGHGGPNCHSVKEYQSPAFSESGHTHLHTIYVVGNVCEVLSQRFSQFGQICKIFILRNVLR